MSTRQCPKCGRVYSASEFYKKLFFKPVWAKWTCESCGTELTFDKKRRVILAVIKVLWLYVLFLLKDVYKDNWLWYGFLMVLLIAVFVLLSLFNKFEEVKKQ